jgi:hypothetical protein
MEAAMSNAAVKAAECYVIEGIKNKNLSKVPLDPSVVFQGPFQGLDAPLRGIDALQEFLDGIYPIIKDAHIRTRVASGDEVCLIWELETSEPPAVIPILEYFRVEGGRLVEIRPFYDPRPLTGG